MTAKEQQRREGVRLQAAERFARGGKSAVIAAELRVSVRSVERWRRAWQEDGTAALRSSVPAKRPYLDDEQFAELERELEKGPAAHGWEDQRWTLQRIKTVISRRFQVTYTVQGVWKLLRRHGWSYQRPVRRAVERDKRAVEVWKEQVWPQVEHLWRRSMPGWSSKTKPECR